MKKKKKPGPAANCVNCNDVLGHLYEYINRCDISPDECSKIEEHLEACRNCFTRYEFEQKLLERFRASAGPCVCPESVKKKIQSLLDRF